MYVGFVSPFFSTDVSTTFPSQTFALMQKTALASPILVSGQSRRTSARLTVGYLTPRPQLKPPYYCAPELLDAKGVARKREPMNQPDMYSLPMVLVGVRPFSENTTCTGSDLFFLSFPARRWKDT